MQKFYEHFSFLLAFMILVNVFYMMFGAKFTEGFLILVLLGMLITNASKLETLFTGIK